MDIVFGLVGIIALIVLVYRAYNANSGSSKGEFLTAAAAVSVVELALTVFFFSYLPFIWIGCAIWFTSAACYEYYQRTARIAEYANINRQRDTQGRSNVVVNEPILQRAPATGANVVVNEPASRRAPATGANVVADQTPLQRRVNISCIANHPKVRRVSLEGNEILIETIPMLAHMRGSTRPQYRIGPFLIRINIPSETIKFTTLGPTRFQMIAPHVKANGFVCLNSYASLFASLFKAWKRGENERAFGDLFCGIVRFLEEAAPSDVLGSKLRYFDSASEQEIRQYDAFNR